VKFVKPYLLSPDLEVRRAAVEAMKQLSLPSAAKALREAAERSNSPNDKAEFMKAAEFVELPPYIPRSQRPPPQ
jgi:HEAT repeat protein